MKPSARILKHFLAAAALSSATTGAAITLPYEAGLNTGASFGDFLIVDANGDGNTWSLDSRDNTVSYTASAVMEADDWLISPPLYPETGRQYRITITATATGRDCPERFEARIGTGTDPENYTRQILYPTQIVMGPGEPAYIIQSSAFMLPTQDTYYVGIRANSQPDMGTLTIRRFKIEEVSPDAPHSVIDLNAKAADDGSKEVALSFIAPTFSYTGQFLSQPLSRIEVYCNGALINTFTDVPPATEVSFTDRRNDLIHGVNLYSVIPYCGESEGELATKRVFVGHDVPRSVTNIMLQDRDTYLSVGWDAVPTEGKNGGPVVLSDVYYNVYLATPIYEFGVISRYDHTYLKRIKGRRTDIDVHNLNLGDIEPLFVAIGARNNSGESNMVYQPFLKGAPYTTPYAESFRDCQTDSYIEIETGDNGVHTLARLTPDSSDDDMGALALLGISQGSRVAMTTAKIDIREIEDPVLRFSACNRSGTNNLDVSVITPDYKSHHIHATIPSDHYEEFCVPLSDYRNERWIRLKFTGTFPSPSSEEEPAELLLDAISVRDVNDNGVAGVPRDDTPLTAPPCTIDGRILHPGIRPSGVVIINGRALLLK